MTKEQRQPEKIQCRLKGNPKHQNGYLKKHDYLKNLPPPRPKENRHAQTAKHALYHHPRQLSA